MIKNIIISDIEKALKKLDLPIEGVTIVTQEKEELGDFSSPLPLKLAKDTKMAPMELAEKLQEELSNSENFTTSVSFPGFLNFKISPTYYHESLKDILKKKDLYGQSKFGNNHKVIVEFISANPTGPLTLGNGRGGFMGDTLSAVLQKVGYNVIREYYVNDGGNQIDNTLANSIRKVLGYSVEETEDSVFYGGDYLKPIAEKVAEELGDLDSVPNPKVGKKAAELIMADLIIPMTARMGIAFDEFFPESQISTKEKLDNVLKFLLKHELTYEEDGAIWFKASKFGHFKNQVIITSKASPTYFFKDLAYYYDKFHERKIHKNILFLGADHHGIVEGHKSAVRALGYGEQLDVIVYQLVRLIKDGQEFRMSKRRGTFVTMEDLLEIVGLDAARFFFINTHQNTHMDFDLDLATEKSDRNPVYYVQYAHARMSSILAKASFEPKGSEKLQKLTRQTELNLIKHLSLYPDLIHSVALSYDVSQITKYLLRLADRFHHYYEDVRVISDEKDLSEARLTLVFATRAVLRNGLELIGVSHPDRM